jgi:hypothetical protein
MWRMGYAKCAMAERSRALERRANLAALFARSM